MYSLVFNKQVLPFKYKKIASGIYVFYTGEIRHGVVGKDTRGWYAQSTLYIGQTLMVRQFISKTAAAEFLVTLFTNRYEEFRGVFSPDSEKQV